jgi:Fic family protein
MSDRYVPPYRITPVILHNIEQIGEALGRLRLDSENTVLPVLRRGIRIKTIQASLAIEGNSLSLEQVTAVISGKRVLAPPREIQEVRNAFAAYEELPNWDPYSRKDLLVAHSLMMAGLVDEIGVFRSGKVGIQRGGKMIRLAPPANRAPGLLEQLLAWLEKTDEHPLVASCVFLYEFEFIHPFQNGNGRMGRLWQTLILSHWRPVFAILPVETIIRDRQQDYYAALGQADQAADATAFIEFMLNAILRGIEESTLLSDQESDYQSDQVMRLLRALRKSQRSTSDLMIELGLVHRPTFRKNYLHPALKAGLIEMTQPDTPRAPNQKYRLTVRGKRLADKGEG